MKYNALIQAEGCATLTLCSCQRSNGCDDGHTTTTSPTSVHETDLPVFWHELAWMLRRVSGIKGWCRHDVQQLATWKPISTNIYTMVPFRWMRCVFFLGSMALYTTDVVRSGLGIRSLAQFSKSKVGIDTFSGFGPYAYPMQKITRVILGQQDQFHAIAETNVGAVTQLDQVKVWSYKSDTLAVGLRALAMQLNVTEYPKCLLTTKTACPSAFLALNTTFWMLDALFDAIQMRFLTNDSRNAAFAIEHQRIDTLEQTLYGMVRNQTFVRYFTIHSYQQSATHDHIPVELLAICQHWDTPPSFCSSPPWKTRFVVNGTVTPMKLEEHIALRFARFRAQNPQLDFDLLIWTARNPEWIENSASAFYDREAEEIVVLARGRNCTKGDAMERPHKPVCQTMLIDDFRYERSNVETNIEEVFSFVAFIRGLAQVYVWLRVTMLIAGVFVSTWYEAKRESPRVRWIRLVYMSVVNLLKVPSHVVVYGTLFPVVLYALAHLIDCYIYHYIVQDALATILGNVAFLQLNNAVLYVTLKMRNIWLIGIFCTFIVVYNTHYCQRQEWRHRMGVVGFRGTLISFVSFSTLFFPIRFPVFRQIDVFAFTRHSVNWRIDDLWVPRRLEFNAASTGPFLEIRCFLLAVCCFLMVEVVTKAFARLVRCRMPQLMAQSTVVPYSAGILWTTTALTGYWETKLAVSRRRVKGTTIVVPVLAKAGGDQFVVDPMPSHVRALQVEKRKGETWALIRLMNIVMMTNPWVFVRLRFIGVYLFLYRLRIQPGSRRSGGSLSTRTVGRGLRGVRGGATGGGAGPIDPAVTFVLPDRIEILYEMNQLDNAELFEFIGVINSTSLTWNELVMCG